MGKRQSQRAPSPTAREIAQKLEDFARNDPILFAQLDALPQAPPPPIDLHDLLVPPTAIQKEIWKIYRLDDPFETFPPPPAEDEEPEKEWPYGSQRSRKTMTRKARKAHGKAMRLIKSGQYKLKK